MQLAAHLRACDAELSRVLPFAVDGEQLQLEDVAGDGVAVFEVLEDGRRVGAFALEVLEDQAAGRELHCTALAGDSRRVIDAAIDFTRREARERVGARRITCETRRPGLVRLLRRRGWTETGAAGRGVALQLEV